jgi:hypothetical protein
MKIGQVCTRHAVTVRPQDPEIDAAPTMREEHVGAVVVAEPRSGVTAPVGVHTHGHMAVAELSRNLSTAAKTVSAQRRDERRRG